MIREHSYVQQHPSSLSDFSSLWKEKMSITKKYIIFKIYFVKNYPPPKKNDRFRQKYDYQFARQIKKTMAMPFFLNLEIERAF